MKDKILFVFTPKKKLTLRQQMKIMTYIIMGYKVEFIKKEDNKSCKGYRANTYYMYDVGKLEMIK